MKNKFLHTASIHYTRFKLLGLDGVFGDNKEIALNVLFKYSNGQYDSAAYPPHMFEDYFKYVDFDSVLNNQNKPLDTVITGITKTMCGIALSREMENHNRIRKNNPNSNELPATLLGMPMFWSILYKCLSHLKKKNEMDDIAHLTQIIAALEITDNKEINDKIFAFFEKTIEVQTIEGVARISSMPNLIANYVYPPMDRKLENLVSNQYGLDHLISLLTIPENYEDPDGNTYRCEDGHILSFCIFAHIGEKVNPYRESQMRNAIVEKLILAIGPDKLRKVYDSFKAHVAQNPYNEIFQEKVSSDLHLLGISIDTLIEKNALEKSIPSPVLDEQISENKAKNNKI